MEPENEEKIMNEKLQARFKELPKAVQNAITSADVEKKLRELSDTHKLHLDQWQKLENEVMLALLGFQPVENLEANIKNEVGTSDERAKILATDIADTIFQPIREELERELGKPRTEEGKEPVVGSQQPVAEQPVAGSQEPVAEKPVASSQEPVARELNSGSLEPATGYKLQAASSPIPSTPPPAPPMAKSVRAILSPAYAPDTKSHERLAIDDDPYREPIA